MHEYQTYNTVKTTLKKTIFIVAAFFSLSHVALAQSEINNFIRGGINDANTLLGAYVGPLGKSTGANLNAGWTNTAAALKPGRFELKLVGSAAYVPVPERAYNLDALGLGTPSTREVNGSTVTEVWQYKFTQAPTVFGTTENSETIRKVITYQNPNAANEEQAVIAELPIPNGLGIPINPLTPAMQLSVGIPLATEVMIRFLPSAEVASDELALNYGGLWGLGLKHNVKQWIPGLRKLPFSLSVAAAYSTTRASVALPTIVPEVPSGEAFADSTRTSTGYRGPSVDDTDYSGQGAEFRVQAWNVNVLISKEFTLISLYGGLRYAQSTTSVKLMGTYGFAGVPYYNPENAFDPNNRKFTLVNIDNPIHVETTHGQVGLAGGFRFKMGFLALSGEATLSRFSTASIGLSAGWLDLVPGHREVKKNLNVW